MAHSESGLTELANPYLDEYLALKTDEESISPFKQRWAMCRRYAWAIPSNGAIEALVALSPIVEVGAGLGYWAKLVSEAGGDITAYDIEPNPEANDFLANGPWFPVERGDVRKALAGGRRERTLFLCWPPMSDMAVTALRSHRGEHVVYVGEDWSGCTANDEFFHLVEAVYEPVETVHIPQWYGLHDYMTIYRRKEAK